MDLFLDKPLSHSMKGISTLNKIVKEKKIDNTDGMSTSIPWVH